MRFQFPGAGKVIGTNAQLIISMDGFNSLVRVR